MPKELKEGMKAPDFSAASSEGKTISLRELKGKIVVLYFYPKDNTPGCTKEACSFRDRNEELTKMGVVVLGVSPDSLQSHLRFKEKHHLNFPLLLDPEEKIISAYGVRQERKAFEKMIGIINRSTFLIDREGIIRHIWRSVKVDGHVEEIINVIKEKDRS